MERLGNIEAFVEAAELESPTLGAERLRLGPSALTRRIARLEAQLVDFVAAELSARGVER